MEKKIFAFSLGNKLEASKEQLGNKGYNLMEMASFGMPVPPGFILTTNLCKDFLEQDKKLDLAVIKKHLRELEIITGKKFGSLEKPLLLSIRSGGVFSMPGMMETILNVGLNDLVVEALAQNTDRIFAYDSYRRLIQLYGSVVLGIKNEVFYNFIETIDLDNYENLQITIAKFKDIIQEEKGEAFPQDLEVQVIKSIEAVFRSWFCDKAQMYREQNSLSHDSYTAATVQAMVFGNRDNNSATGVLFTRNPISGEKRLFGEFLPKAQGEDVVAGYHNALPLTIADALQNNLQPQISMEVTMPSIFQELKKLAEKLECYYKEMQDIEFTVEEGKVWILQTRKGKRSSAATARIAIALVEENLKSQEEVLIEMDFGALEQALHKQIEEVMSHPIGKGIPASPGAAAGMIALTPEKAVEFSKKGPTILVRGETSPEDIMGMFAAEGFITAKGGVTSHAAVVARGMGKPCICSVGDLLLLEGEISLKGNIIKEGEIITMNGATGDIFLGELPMVTDNLSKDWMILLNWMTKFSKIAVRANAETPEDLVKALEFGAIGVGLCRTEHMFFGSERIQSMRSMILAESKEERELYLKELSVYQKNDFIELLKILNGKSLCIRLLDPPLHEFLPQGEELENFCKKTGVNREKILRKLDSLQEVNPMLGIRGCRLALLYPEIYISQAIAIFEAYLEVKNSTAIEPAIEIMIPLVLSEKELIFTKNLVEQAKKIVLESEKANEIAYKFGAMIELPRTALIADKIAQEVDFVSFGTNDLTQTTLGLSRDDCYSMIDLYCEKNIFSTGNPFIVLDQEGPGELIKIAVNKIKKTKPEVKLGLCGEQGGNPQSIAFLEELGLDYVSCSPYRVPIAKLAASQIIKKNKL